MHDMSLTTPPAGITMADYAAIESAVMETARGRWFLLEFARRQRAVETQRLSDTVDRLELMIAGAQARMQQALPTHDAAAAVAERLSDIVWSMRERGVGDQFCADLEKQIAVIRTLRVEISNAYDPLSADGVAQITLAPPVAPPPVVRDILRLELQAAAPEDAPPTPVASTPGAPVIDVAVATHVEPPTPATAQSAAAAPVVQPPAQPVVAPEAPARQPVAAPAPDALAMTREARIAALARIDALPLTEKLALFC
jgi:hypothetical protein